MKLNMEVNNYFSVVIPLYNKVSYIKRAIQSVLNQSYQLFEIIVVNDGSSDGSEIIVNEFLNEKIKLINQQNSGVSSARNNGVKNASFEFVAFLDADDEWTESFLESINNLINKFPDSGIYATNNIFVLPNKQKTYENYKTIFNNYDIGIIDDYFRIFADRQKSPFSNSNFCMEKNVFLEFGGYKVGVKLTEDSDLWCRVALRKKIAYDVRPQAIYYLETENNSNIYFSQEEFEVTKTLKNALTNLENSKSKSSIKRLIALQQLNYVKRAIITNNKKKALITLFANKIVYYYPVDFIKCFLSLFIPNSLIENIRRKT